MPSFLSANLDYACFVAGALAAFAGLAWGLRRWRRGAVLPRMVWVGAVLVLVGGWWPVEQLGRDEAQKIAKFVGGMAPTYARELARMGHGALTLDTPADDPRLQGMLQATLDWMADNPNAHDIYTLRKLPDGRRVFFVDGDTDYDHDGKISERERGAALGAEYDVPDAGLDRAFRGEGSFDLEPITDQWGTWVGAWAPILDAEGQVEAVLGVDFDAHEWFAAIAEVRRDRIAQLALLLLIVGAAGTAVALLRADFGVRLRAEDAAHQANERWNLIVEQMPLIFIELNPQGEVLAWNPAAERALGYRAGEVLGRKVLDLIVSPAARGPIDQLWSQLLSKTGGDHSINENLTKDGRTVTCEWFNTPVVDRHGKVVSIISLAQDVTGRKHLEEQVQQAQKLQGVGLLAAGIAHDFNNILTIVQGHAELLLGRHDLPVQAVEDIGRIAEASERAATLTRQLLTFSRRQAMFARPIDLNETVSNTAAMLDRVIGAQIEVVCTLASELPPVEADPSMLEQVLTNLAVNARDAMPRGGTLTLTTRFVEVRPEEVTHHPDAQPGPAICLTVADTGTGIPTELLAHIFEPFFTTKEVGKGTGLGLAAVHGIVKQHHGWIEVTSLPDRGTAFEIFLPVSAPADVAMAAPGSTSRASAPEPERVTVLLVEDEPVVRQLARLALQRSGYEVLEAGDGPTAEAVWTRESERIALLCTDLMMPNGLTGRDLAGLLLEDKPALRVVYCSGYSAELVLPGFFEAPGQRFLQKPYLSADLIAVVRECLSGEKFRDPSGLPLPLGEAARPAPRAGPAK